MALKNSSRKGKVNETFARKAMMKLLGVTEDNWSKSAQSKGIFDWMIWNAEAIWFVQVKSNRPPGTEERKRIEACALPPCGRRFIAIVYDGAGARKKQVKLFTFNGNWIRHSDGKPMCW